MISHCGMQASQPNEVGVHDDDDGMRDAIFLRHSYQQSLDEVTWAARLVGPAMPYTASLTCPGHLATHFY